MSGKTIGYIRVSTFDQNPERQLDGIYLDKKFTDKASGKDKQRPALLELMNYVREDDIVVVHSMDRLARNLDDLRSTVKSLNSKKVQIKFIKENLTFSDDSSPISNLLLVIMGAFAEFERSIVKERQMEGIILAKKKGLYKGRAKSLNNEQIEIIREKVLAGIPKAKVALEFNISRRSLYSYLAT